MLVAPALSAAADLVCQLLRAWRFTLDADALPSEGY
jgi:hypothetical protein